MTWEGEWLIQAMKKYINIILISSYLCELRQTLLTHLMIVFIDTHVHVRMVTKL